MKEEEVKDKLNFGIDRNIQFYSVQKEQTQNKHSDNDCSCSEKCGAIYVTY